MLDRTPSSVPRRRRVALPLLIVLATALCAAPAKASVSVAGTGEPAFTNTTTNTHFIGYNRLNTYYSFRPYYSYYVGTGGSNVYNEYGGYIGGQYTQSTGTLFANWQGVPGVPSSLQSGQYYDICVSGQYSLDGSFEVPESQNSCNAGIISGKRSGTTIDTSNPVVSNVAVEGTATYTNKTQLALSGMYSDSVSPPWPAVYICTKENVDPATACNGVTYEYATVCSNAQNGLSTANNPFSCSYTLGSSSTDGPVTFCALAADASLPDKPGDADQFSGFTSNDANLSDPSCGYVIVDRTAPQLSITGGLAPAAVGALQSLSASATDPPAGISTGSGLSAAYTWSWGDNTPNSSGINASHTYTQPGTFQVTLTAADNAGNGATATRTITVSAPLVLPGGTPGGGTPGAGTPGGGTTVGSGGTVTTAPTAQQIAKQVGGSGAAATQTTSAGTLDVLTARKVRLSKKLKALPLAITADQAGDATFALIRGGRILSQAGLKITKPGSLGFKLKLPKRLKAGKYSLKITFRASGASKAATKTIRITFTSPKRAKKAARAARKPVSVSGGAPAAPGLGTPASDSR